MSGVRKLAKSAMWPVRRLLDPRFADVARRIEYTGNRAVDESRLIERRQEELGVLIGTFGAASNESLAFLGRQIREFEGALGELTSRMASVEGTVEDTIGPVMLSRRLQELQGGVELIDDDAAALLNYAEGHRGFAAQRGVWNNPPLSLEYVKGDVRLGSVNERIVEIPYAFRALAGLEPPAAI